MMTAEKMDDKSFNWNVDYEKYNNMGNTAKPDVNPDNDSTEKSAEKGPGSESNDKVDAFLNDYVEVGLLGEDSSDNDSGLPDEKSGGESADLSKPLIIVASILGVCLLVLVGILVIKGIRDREDRVYGGYGNEEIIEIDPDYIESEYIEHVEEFLPIDVTPEAEPPAVTAAPVISESPTSVPPAPVASAPASQTSASETYDYYSIIGSNPKSEYGRELISYLNGAKYPGNAREMVDVIGSTYYARKDSAGKYVEGCRSYRNESNSTGYILSFYYADDCVYFAEVRNPADVKETFVKLHYWGDQIVGYRDDRNGKGNFIYLEPGQTDAITQEFSTVYDIGMGRKY